MTMFMRVAVFAITLLYPVGVYFGLQYFDPRTLVFLLVALLVVRFFTLQKTPTNHWIWLPVIALLGLWTWVGNTDTALKFYPILVNVSFLAMFGWSLKQPPSMIERFARIQEGDINEYAANYMRKVTIAWCVFFVANGAASTYTCFWATDEVWALYNGFISYILLGAMFAIEWLIRQQVMKRSDV